VSILATCGVRSHIKIRALLLGSVGAYATLGGRGQRGDGAPWHFGRGGSTAVRRGARPLGRCSWRVARGAGPGGLQVRALRLAVANPRQRDRRPRPSASGAASRRGRRGGCSGAPAGMLGAAQIARLLAAEAPAGPLTLSGPGGGPGFSLSLVEAVVARSRYHDRQKARNMEPPDCQAGCAPSSLSASLPHVEFARFSRRD
jgi:hypothetical protein